MNIKHIFILIPAKNEELLLPRCLYSILDASRMISPHINIEIILCVDSSTDNTFEIGKKILNNKGKIFSCNKGNVGAARRMAAQYALEKYQGSLRSCWIANTDADCKVPIDWLEKQLLWANNGKHAITGIVKVDSYEEHHPAVPKLFQNDYVIHPDGSHPHIHGANLGVRADVYLKVGGWRELSTAEDHDLWNRLNRLNFELVTDANLFVITSGRKVGRAPMGFANKLDSYNGLINDNLGK
ncbi:MAG: glycosyltransferase [Legionella longbeachae]|nr:glycosyltransferase [Legionella longbeachae]